MPPWLATAMQASPSTHFVSFAQSILYRGADLAARLFRSCSFPCSRLFLLRCRLPLPWRPRWAPRRSQGSVLPTRLSAVDEAASMDVLCSDKTGTLTQNELAVTAVRPMGGFDEARVLQLAALASADTGPDPVDTAVRTAASRYAATDSPQLLKFIPFDPSTKMAEASAVDRNGAPLRAVKGAFAIVSGLAGPSPDAASAAHQLEKQGFRVLAVAVGTPTAMRIAGVLALSDPPRADSKTLLVELNKLGVKLVMATGDAPITASVVASEVGLSGAISPPGPIPAQVHPEDFSIFAGVLPEDKYRLVKAFQNGGHTVGMCGDGANDAPALRQLFRLRGFGRQLVVNP
jgi:H+-transporting ATPase